MEKSSGKNVGYKAVCSDKVWNVSKTGKPSLNKDYDVIGKVDKRCPSMVLKPVKKGSKQVFVEDLYRFSNQTKNSVANFFFDKNNKNRNVVYLVKSKKAKSKSMTDIDKFIF